MVRLARVDDKGGAVLEQCLPDLARLAAKRNDHALDVLVLEDGVHICTVEHLVRARLRLRVRVRLNLRATLRVRLRL